MKFRRAPFADLADGGAALADELRETVDAVLIAVLPGGAPVARVVADELHLPLLALRVDRTNDLAVELIGAELSELAGRSVVLIDDGVESGTSARAAISYLKTADLGHLTFAVPVCHAEAAAQLGSMVDELIAPRRPFTPRALRWEYVTFAPPADDAAALAIAQPLGW